MLQLKRRIFAPTLVFALFLPAARAQMPGMTMSKPDSKPAAQSQPAMDMSNMGGAPETSTGAMQYPRTLTAVILQHTSSGTTVEPLSSPTPMWMGGGGRKWIFMVHGSGFVAETQQHASNSRGGDGLFSTNWIMPMAQHKLGRGQITFRSMLSLEPATITHRFYPELFQQGETAFGRPIVDGQHPHDFVMELAALYDLQLSEHSLLSFYAAPVGDPAIGPTAYPHRLTASEDPIAALGHHQEDSTHIAFNVLTAGLTYKTLRLEASGFYGAEPDERRWHFQPSPNGLAVDSYSGRLTYSPTPDLIAQYSIAHITSPEALAPQDDQRRQTASVMFNRPIGARHDTSSMPGMDMATPATGNWSTTILWGQTLSLPSTPEPNFKSLENSYLLESLLNFRRRNFVWTRVEVAARTSELLDTPQSPPTSEHPIGHVQAYTVGYDRQYCIAPHLLAAPGVQFTVYRTPDALASIYGRTPVGGVAFIRFRIAQ